MGKLNDVLRRLWSRLSKDYDEYVTNKLTAYPEIRLYENFEEALVLGILRRLAERGEEIAFIEAGSGTGRYMELLGSKITRELISVNNVSLGYDDKLSNQLKLIVGIDFAAEMIEKTQNKLKQISDEKGRNLYDRITGENRLKLITGPIEGITADVILASKEGRLNRFVCCLFGTLGNVSEENRQKALEHLVDWTGDNGILLLSVFNQGRLKDLGYHSYQAVKGLIGTPDFDYDKGNVTTDKEFSSHWFSFDELYGMAREKVRLRHRYIVIGENLAVRNNQHDSRRGLLLVASKQEIRGWLCDVLKEIKGEEVPQNTVKEVS
jgi:hypothetical protein